MIPESWLLMTYFFPNRGSDLIHKYSELKEQGKDDEAEKMKKDALDKYDPETVVKTLIKVMGSKAGES